MALAPAAFAAALRRLDRRTDEFARDESRRVGKVGVVKLEVIRSLVRAAARLYRADARNGQTDDFMRSYVAAVWNDTLAGDDDAADVQG